MDACRRGEKAAGVQHGLVGARSHETRDGAYLMETVDPGSGVAAGLENNRPGSSAEALQEVNGNLQKQNLELRAILEGRAASISHLAHELRTPLTSILGFAEILLSQEELTSAQRNFCQRIQNSAHQLQDSLTRLSELSRVEIPGDETSD